MSMNTLRKLMARVLMVAAGLFALGFGSGMLHAQQSTTTEDDYGTYEDEYDPSLNPGGKKDESGKEHYYKNRPGYSDYYRK